MEFDAVRTFAVVAVTGQFQRAAVELGLTQQAVSKRIAGLERELGVVLFDRTPRGVQLSIDGQAFLPHARELVRRADRAVEAVRPGARALRVDVISRRIAPAGLVRGFHEANPGMALDVVTLLDAATAFTALQAGRIDATFRAVSGRLPDRLRSRRVLDEPIQLLTGPRHPFADRVQLRPEDLAGSRIWMPGNTPGTEWTDFYERLATRFGFTIDSLGPNFGMDHLFEVLAESAEVATFTGERIRHAWPAGFDLRRIDLVGPPVAYPHSLVWRHDNPHPGLAALRRYLPRA